MLDYLQRFNDAIVIISFISNFLFLIIPLSIKIFNYFFNLRYIKKLLGYNKEAVKITQCVFTFNTQPNIFVPYSSVLAINNIIKLFYKVNKKFYLDEQTIDSKNEMNIGGFSTNQKVSAYFKNLFPNFKYIINIKAKETFEKFPINQNIYKYSNSNKRGFLINDKFLNNTDKNIDYAFLIKLTKDDFKDDENRSVHIVFGGTDIGTIKATEFLLTHYKQIYAKYKKNHYFFAIEINLTDNSINYSRGIIDFTDTMFQYNTQ